MSAVREERRPAQTEAEWAVKFVARHAGYRALWMRRARQYKRRGGDLSAFSVKACVQNARLNNRDVVWAIKLVREHCK